jgi:hypothetical protein
MILRRIAIVACLAFWAYLGLSIAASARAAILAEAPSPSGAGTAVLYDEKRFCMGDAQYAEWVAKDGTKIPGCWRAAGGTIVIVFVDTDTATIPMQALQPPKNI